MTAALIPAAALPLVAALIPAATDPTAVTSLVVALKTITLVLGGLITFFAFKAYRRTDSPALRALTIGFGAVTLGSMVAGLLDRLVLASTEFALVAESALTAVGFAVILYSLYVD